MNAIVEISPPPSRAFRGFDRLLRENLLSRMAALQHGYLVISDQLGTVELGASSSRAPRLSVHVEVLDPGFYRAIASNGSVGAAEAYMDGLWRCDNLVGLIQLLVRNRDLLDKMEGGLAWLGGMAMRAWHAVRRNTRHGSRHNIAAHYDLGNDFFGLFLSSDLMYSSALWSDVGDTLEAASSRKLETICRRLNLKPGDRVIEIGTGWGGFALYAAQHIGCHVTTTTISHEQYALARRRVDAAKLQDRVTVLRQDYRELEGCYDKLVSIEMIEAVGAEYLEVYFAKLGKLLKPDGVALLQAITIEDHRYAQAQASVDFIKRHVFPGSFIPSISAMLAAKTRVSDLSLIDLKDFGDSYARTLHAWRERFMAHLSQVRALGFPERFIRKWEFYLAYCEGGFRERSIGVAHLLLARPGYRYREDAQGA